MYLFNIFFMCRATVNKCTNLLIILFSSEDFCTLQCKGLEPPLVSSYFARKMVNRCSDLLKQAEIHLNRVYKRQKQSLYKFNKLKSQCLVLTPLFFKRVQLELL